MLSKIIVKKKIQFITRYFYHSVDPKSRIKVKNKFEELLIKD